MFKSTLIVTAALCLVCMVAVPSGQCQDQDPLLLIEDAAGMFNERGYLKSNSFSLDGEEIINDFNGNLIYTQRLRYMPILQNGLNFDLKIAYNGSVGHVVNGGLDLSDPDHCGPNSFNMPEWIISVNNIAIQTFNFENEAVSFNTVQEGDTLDTYDSEIAALINGYHSCYSRFEELGDYYGNISILMGDGSVRRFISLKEQTVGEGVVEGEYRSFSKEDRAKGWVDSDKNFTLFLENGTKVLFKLHIPRWRRNVEPNTPYDAPHMYLPERFTDVSGHGVHIYYIKSSLWSGYGRPLVEFISAPSNIYFNWVGIGTEQFYRLRLFEGTRWNDYTPDSDAWYRFEFTPLSASDRGEVNRALVSTIVDPIHRYTTFSYTPYRRIGQDFAGCLDVPVIIDEGSSRERYQVTGDFIADPDRLTRIDYPTGGYTEFTYYPSSNLAVDYGVDCFYDDRKPCKKSSEFDNLGRDPYFINMVTLCERFDESGVKVSSEQLQFSWSDYQDDGFHDVQDTFYTHRTLCDPTSDTCKALDFTYRYYTEFGPYSLDTRDRGWLIKLLSTRESSVGEIVLPPKFAAIQSPPDYPRAKYNYWNNVTKLLDSSVTITDGVSATEEHSYVFVNGDASDQRVSSVTQATTTTALGVQTKTFYDTSFIDIFGADSYYNNSIARAVKVEDANNVLLDMAYSTYYGPSDDEPGYEGQLKETNRYFVVGGEQQQDWVQERFEYYAYNDYRRINGALRKRVMPKGDSIVYHYWDSVMAVDQGMMVFDSDPLPNPGPDARNPVTYYELNVDGSVDTVEAQFTQSNKHQWYKVVSYIGSDSLVRYQKQDAQWKPVLIVEPNRFVTRVAYDPLDRVTQVNLPGSWASDEYLNSPPIDSVVTGPTYDCETSGADLEFDDMCDTILATLVKDTVYLNEWIWEEQNASFSFAGVDYSTMHSSSIDSAFLDLFCMSVVGTDTVYINGIKQAVSTGPVRFNVTNDAMAWAQQNTENPCIDVWPCWESSDFIPPPSAPMLVPAEAASSTAVPITVTASAGSTNSDTRSDVCRLTGWVDYELKVPDCASCDTAQATIYNSGNLIRSIECGEGTVTGSFLAELGDIVTASVYIESEDEYVLAAFTHRAIQETVRVQELGSCYKEASGTIDVAANIAYELHVPGDDGSCGTASYAAIYVNGGPSPVELTYNGTDSQTVTGTVFADSGDVLTVVVDGDCFDATYPGIYAEFVHYPFVHPNPPRVTPLAVFCSSENSDPARRPVMSIYYTLERGEDSCSTIRYIYDDFLSDGNGISATRMVRRDTLVFPQTTQTFFDGFGRPVRTKFIDSTGSSNSVWTAYDFAGRADRTTDQLGNQTINTYDNLDRTLSTEFPSSLAENPNVSFGYSDAVAVIFGTPYDCYKTTHIDENGVEGWDYHDVLGQLREQQRYSGGITHFTFFDYDDLGNLTRVMRPESDEVTYEYNSLGWLTSETSADAGTILYEYDKNGNVIRKRDGNISHLSGGVWWMFTDYDDLDRVTVSGLVDYPPGYPADTLQRFFYDQETSAISKGRLSISLSTESGDDYGEQYDYDARGRIVAQKNVFSPDLTGTSGEYTLVLRPGTGHEHTIEYGYNHADQLTSLTYPDGSVVTYHYDDRGRLASVGSKVGQTEYPEEYASFEYTARDEIERMTLGANVQQVDYAYNERGWLTSINDGVIADIDKFGQQLYYYDPPTGGTAQKNGNVAGQKIAIYGENDYTYLYDYDNLDRLIDVSEDGSPIEHFQYDMNGNRLYYEQDGFANRDYRYRGESNRLDSTISSDGSLDNVYEYDFNGNVTFDSAKKADFTYDIYNQLETVVIDGAYGDNIISFAYNNAGQRVSKSYHYNYRYVCGTGGANPVFDNAPGNRVGAEETDGPPVDYCYGSADIATYYVRGAGGKVLAEYFVNSEGDYDLLRKYIYAGDQRIAMIDDKNKVFYYLNDHLGSARVVVSDQTGEAVDKYSRYWAFGADAGFTIETDQPFTYTGKPFDNESGIGLHYYGARYYDADMGRFMAIDPLAAKYPGLSPYIYCANNPINSIDRDGRAGSAVLGGAAAAELAMAAITLAAASAIMNSGEADFSSDFAAGASCNLAVMYEFAKTMATVVVTGTAPAATESATTEVSTTVEASRTKQQDKTKRTPPPTSAGDRSKESKRDRTKPADGQPTNDTATRDKGPAPRVLPDNQLHPRKPHGSPWPKGFPKVPPPYFPGGNDENDKIEQN